MKLPTFIEQLEPYASDREAYGPLCADFHDLREACEWFLSAAKANEAKALTSSELQDLLIDIDVHFVEHASFHLKSFRKELAKVLNKFPAGDDTATA